VSIRGNQDLSTIYSWHSIPALRSRRTDAPVLSRWAKIMMMIQALISLLIVALLPGRAVNIL
jgi:hypothetical protein